MDNKKLIILSAAIIIGFALSAFILGRALQRFKKEDRFISVKGFSEREVKADLAVWTIRARVAGNDLMEGSKTVEDVKNKVIDFLLRNSVKQDEIIQKDLIVNDKKAQEYGNFKSDEGYRFIIDKIIQVRSSNVDNIQKVSRMTDELLKAGVVINTREYEGAVKYYYTKLNEIKPEMMVDATRNAKDAAIKFAVENKTKLGRLKKASQGYFSIVDRDESLSGQGDPGYGSGINDLYKKVRVVISIDYSLY